ncbi:MAG: hypothetical protein ACR2ME_10575, partial [Acidimicrobiia bacterium]
MKAKQWPIVVAVLAMVLAACGGGEAATTAGETPGTTVGGGGDPAGSCMGITPEEGATIVFSGWGDETEQQVYRDSITRFNEACP